MEGTGYWGIGELPLRLQEKASCRMSWLLPPGGVHPRAAYFRSVGHGATLVRSAPLLMGMYSLLGGISGPPLPSECLSAFRVSQCHLEPSFAFRLPQGLHSVSVPPQA
eukprot:scaffold151068_cov19-Tisochrysis_lutea.AAC.2